jgi:hypothetical protein
MMFRRALIVVSASILILYVPPWHLTQYHFRHVGYRLRNIRTWVTNWQTSPKYWKPGDACPTEIHGIATTLSHDLTNDDRMYNFDSMGTIHKALLNCDTVQSIYLRSGRWPGGGHGRFTLPLHPRGGDRFLSAPKVLSLDGYDAEGRWPRDYPRSCQWAWRWNDWFSPSSWKLWLGASPERKSNLELWLNAMDFSHVHTLHLNRTTVLFTADELLASKLPNLQTLIADGSQARNFLLALPPNSLKHLTWRNMFTAPLMGNSRSPPSPIFQRHGASLLTLNIKSDEFTGRAAPMLPLEQLQELTSLAPVLTHLTLNLGRHKASPEDIEQIWPWEKLTIIAAGFPQLTHLTIYFPLVAACRRTWGDAWGPHDYSRIPNCSGPDQYSKPMLSMTSAKEMAEVLSRHKPGKGFESIVFRAGDWKEPWERPGWNSPEWMTGKRTWAECVPEGEGGGMHCEGGDTLGLDECWDEYMCIGCGSEDGIMTDWWERRCPGDKVGDDTMERASDYPIREGGSPLPDRERLRLEPARGGGGRLEPVRERERPEPAR